VSDLPPDFWIKQAERAYQQADALRDLLDKAAEQIRQGRFADALETCESGTDEDDERMGVLRLKRPPEVV
jgi:hypothetical protein